MHLLISGLRKQEKTGRTPENPGKNLNEVFSFPLCPVHAWGPPIGLRDCVIGYFFLRDCVKPNFFLRECVKRDACVMRESPQLSAWLRERPVFGLIFAWLREKPYFPLRENEKKSAWMRDWAPPLGGPLRKSWNLHKFFIYSSFVLFFPCVVIIDILEQVSRR